MPYVLSIRSSPKGPYADSPVTYNDDGSWSFRYAREENKGRNGDGLFTNKALRACMEKRIPVGVLYKESEQSPYHVVGLALPTKFEETFFLFESYKWPTPPVTGGRSPVVADEERHGRPGGFLRPFKTRADTDYIAYISGGAFRRGRTHETLVNDFAEWLASKGLLAASTAAIDLGLEDPPVIIEAKVIRPGGWASAIREAIGQLYEYRYFQVVAPQSGLLFLASIDIPREWLDYLDNDRQIGAAWRSSQGEFLLTDRARKMLGVNL
jgi:hypothetical protein